MLDPVFALGIAERFAGTGAEAPVVPPVVEELPAGRSRARRRQFVIAIDGVDFLVSGLEEAQELLDQARQLAKEQTEEIIHKAKRQPTATESTAQSESAVSLPELRPPAIKSSSDLPAVQDLVRLVQEQLALMFRDADREVQRHREQMQTAQRFVDMAAAYERDMAAEQEMEIVVAVMMML